MVKRDFGHLLTLDSVKKQGQSLSIPLLEGFPDVGAVELDKRWVLNKWKDLSDEQLRVFQRLLYKSGELPDVFLLMGGCNKLPYLQEMWKRVLHKTSCGVVMLPCSEDTTSQGAVRYGALVRICTDPRAKWHETGHNSSVRE
jgi:hypothetical protein